MAQPQNLRIFPVAQRGVLREDMLTSFRVGARALSNPRTGQPWTDAEIAAATAKGSPKYIEADAIDLVLQLEYQRALWLADQVQQGRASTRFLQEMHGPTWGLAYLPAAGGSGDATATGQPGTVFVGSTTIGAPTACTATDQSGRVYQVAYTTSIALPSDTSVAVTFLAVDTGEQTNLAPGAELRWNTNVPLGADAIFKVATQFTGGVEAETDAQFVRRLQRRSRHKAGSGNRAELCAWAEAYSASIDVAFAYSCILYNGSGMLVPTVKRGGVRGPTGRIPGVAFLAELTAYLVPPGSPVVPDFGLLLVVPPRGVSSDMVVSLAMPFGTDAGWADYQPWPKQSGGTAVTISALTDQTHFQVQCSTGLPLGVTAPQMMVWIESSSSFEKLNVSSVVLASGTTYNVTLTSAPVATLAVGHTISPYTELASVIADTVQAYFDDLGPGEVIDVSSVSTDPRRSRAYRFVVPNEEYPYRAGAGVTTYLQEALVGSFVDGLLESVSVAVPALPSDPVLGPGLLVAGKLMISPL